ncbi:hypothetical protein RJ639_036977 [Escallonia herrerae]|uniref:G-patch domain-containing protein n=1 Tax=Escallonia herrerae TaxID=1293975 RepID=A0AA88X6V4_9ASTE|nr:hypothetical protein RJ639_036977 [Escallonia herrerae]
MAGGAKRGSKSKPRRPAGGSSSKSLFVDGGVLSDWFVASSPPSRGRNSSSGRGNTRSDPRPGTSGRGRGRVSAQRPESRRPRGNAVGFVYPVADREEHSLPDDDDNLDEPIVLIDSKETKIVAYTDKTPTECYDVKYTYDYNTDFGLDDNSHTGLGFSESAEAAPSVSCSKMEDGSASSEADMETDVGFLHEASTKKGDDAETPSPKKNSGFLSIGGLTLYTEDISDEEGDEDDGEEWLDDESLESSGSEDITGSSDSDSSSASDDLPDNVSDVDDEVAEDYFKGIGGIENVVNVDQLVGNVDVSDDDGISGGSFTDTLKRLGGIALQNASMEHGKKPQSRRKSLAKSCGRGAASYAWSSTVDDLMLVKDPRTASGRKKSVSRFPKSLSFEAQRNKNCRRFPGFLGSAEFLKNMGSANAAKVASCEKKKHRKEMIAVKRRERMIRRGIDLEKINLKLQQMVLDGKDILSFQPMHSKDCSQVQRLAAIYRLRSGCQVKGDRSTAKKASKTSGLRSLDLSVKNLSKYRNTETRKKKSEKTGSYAAHPVSFVSSGILDSEIVEIKTTADSRETDTTCPENKGVASSSEYGAFELHTTGFGSKMMAKMGYIEGGGLGKDGQGVAEPIEVFQRPKSLGLGANIPEASMTEPNRVSQQPKSSGHGAKAPGTGGRFAKMEFHQASMTEPNRVSQQPKSSGHRAKAPGTGGRFAKMEFQQFAAFEKHTKGFGSKMMAKMGFIEGTGLGKDSQGIQNPFVASRLPRSRGLGAKG